MAGTKRPAGVDLSPRPTKLRRVGSGKSDVVMAMRAQLGDGSKTDSQCDEGLVFLNASAEAISAFDWTGLVGVLDDEVKASGLGCEDQDLLVNVPGAVRRIPISRRVILKEILNHLGLKVFDFGVVVESPDAVRAWIDMEIPCYGVAPVKGRQKFYGDEAAARSEAMESVCGVAISYLHSSRFVLVEDINYEEVRSLQRRALAAETWCMLLTDALDGGKSNNKAIRDAYSTFFLEAKGLCKDFGDVFGVGTIGTASTSSAPGDEKVYYGGPRPPISRAEQFAFGLVDLINRSADVVMAVDDVVAG